MNSGTLLRPTEAGEAQEMTRVYNESSYVLDPHTAVAVNAARRALARAISAIRR